VRDPELQESPNLDEKPTTPQADARAYLIVSAKEAPLMIVHFSTSSIRDDSSRAGRRR